MGERWHEFIRARHLRIAEYKTYKNQRYVRGCPDRFEFGDSEFISKDKIADVLASCFKEPFSGSPQIFAESEFPPLQTTSSALPAKPDHRKIIIVGHDLRQDVAYCEKVGFPVLDRQNVIDTMDTVELFRVYSEDTNARSLGSLLCKFDLAGWNLHNAGNDAVYTMRAMLAICVQAASKTGTDETERKRAESEVLEIAQEQAREDTGGCELADGEGRGGAYTFGGVPVDV